jgi:CubicO group peptidase (beta-lactamase class C family)
MARPMLPERGAAGMVIGLLEADGTRRVVSVGGAQYDGRTIFEIGSVTKVFTGALLGDMVERGEVRLDQPVAELLPDGVRVPSRNGRQITLVDLATHSSGLGRPQGRQIADRTNPWGDYTTDLLYDLLRSYELTRDVGEAFEYSNVGVGLLGHALALRSDTSYEALVTSRILRPLGMFSTVITVDDSVRDRVAPGHNEDGERVASWTTPGIQGAGALRSTADDLLTFVGANLSPPDGPLGRALRRSHEPHFSVTPDRHIALNWMIVEDGVGNRIHSHGGATGGYRAYVAFDSARGVGLVVLANFRVDLELLALHLMEPRFPLTTQSAATMFALLVLIVVVLLTAGVVFAWRRTRAPRPWLAGLLTFIAAAAWLMAAFVAMGQLITVDNVQVAVVLAMLLAVMIAVGVGVSRVGVRLATGLPLTVLVAAQSFRLALELIMHRTYAFGVLPGALAFDGYTPEVAIGVLSLVVALLVAAGRAGERTIRAWNWLGLVLLLSLVAISWLNPWAGLSLFILIPTVMLPFAVLGHVAVFRRLRLHRLGIAAAHLRGAILNS